jgi:hypothetical protein
MLILLYIPVQCASDAATSCAGASYHIYFDILLLFVILIISMHIISMHIIIIIIIIISASYACCPMSKINMNKYINTINDSAPAASDERYG